ncbi:LysR family transcriptional regulator [Hyphomicrobium sp. 99]|uniref:LysR family transcriptional regulator n=1 Tax=Hyphomicrobium sp. 99 TaxID=1163419 RepID=UPI0006961D8A|nr:LysR family transcriptional regulator [Hyphomicrobium sp. 99]
MPSNSIRHDDFIRNLDWNLFKVFCIIAETGGVTAAAELLRRKQPSISLALQRLEGHLNVRLCERGPSGFELTDEGRALADTCMKLKALVRGIPDAMANTLNIVSGPVRIKMISNVVSEILDDVILSFHRKCPNAELIVDVASWSDVINSLLRQEIDIGVAPSRSKRADLIYHPLFRETHRPYCGRGHRLYGQKLLDPRALAQEAFILTGADEPDQLSDFRLKYGIGQKVSGISQHLEEARRLAILGVGVCFLPEGYAAPDVSSGRLWPLLGKRHAPAMEIFIISNPDRPLHLAHIFFIEELKATISEAKRVRGHVCADATTE